MKCVKCKTDNNLKERTEAGGRCKNCNHPFVFDPKAGSKFTDIFFNNSIQTISSENTLFFTPKQLWYFIEKRLEIQNITPFVNVFASSFLLAIAGNIGAAMEFYFLSPIIGFLILISFLIWGSQAKQFKTKKRINFARSIQVIGGLILLSSVVLFFKCSTLTNTAFFLFLLGIGLGIFLIYFGTRQLSIQHKIPQPFQFHQSQIIQWLIRWQEINGKVTNVLRT
ncbi:MAG: hypothetical protein F6K01_35195, partial [Okeania sp. SIO1I7]|nr:hypothetical protein [Okeania sp. SIO1I7]